MAIKSRTLRGKSSLRVFVQARMSSARFPAKVLAPLHGKPIIRHVLDRAELVFQRDRIVITTSTDVSDDPLAAYVKELGVAVFRGPLENVFARFQMCLQCYPCDWFFRVCADSPLLDETLMMKMSGERRDGVDLVTNIQPRTFPVGQSLELVNSETFAAIDSDTLSAEESEHVTRVLYAHPERFRIVNISSSDRKLARKNLAVDTIDDLRRIERLPIGVNQP